MENLRSIGAAIAFFSRACFAFSVEKILIGQRDSENYFLRELGFGNTFW